MAHPDDGYLIPDDEWEGMVDPFTGENFYPEDQYASYRLELIRFWQDFRGDVTRPGYQERRAKLRQRREVALNARVDPKIENAE